MTIKSLQQKLADFREQRNWKKFHTPRNLATSLTLEATEVLEKFQWKLDNSVTSEEREELKEELADVLIYLVQLAEVLDIDLLDAADKKVTKNAQKYPVEKSKGNAKKYTTFK